MQVTGSRFRLSGSLQRLAQQRLEKALSGAPCKALCSAIVVPWCALQSAQCELRIKVIALRFETGVVLAYEGLNWSIYLLATPSAADPLFSYQEVLNSSPQSTLGLDSHIRLIV